MFNRILMELYDDYAEGNVESLIEFSNKTFNTDFIKTIRKNISKKQINN